MDCLRLIIADEKIISKEIYLSRDGLAPKSDIDFLLTTDEKEIQTEKSPSLQQPKCCG